MGFNYGYEKKKFDSRWKRLEVEYCDAGMSEEQIAAMKEYDWAWFCSQRVFQNHTQASVYKGYKRDKIEMRGDRAEMSDFPLYLNTVAGGLDCRNQAIGGFSFVVKIYALPVVEIIGKFLYLLGRYGFDAQIGYGF